MSLNKVFLIGNLGGDPEVTMTPTGKIVAHFNLATSYGTGEDQKTQWHTIVAWERTAELCREYLQKGSKVFVEGSLQYRVVDGVAGTKKYFTEIVAHRIEFLTPKPAGPLIDGSESLAIQESVPEEDAPF